MASNRGGRALATRAGADPPEILKKRIAEIAEELDVETEAQRRRRPPLRRKSTGERPA